MSENLELWEILVPTKMERNGQLKPIKKRYHKVWDSKVRSISGGMTILTPTKGQWISPDGHLFEERMIPVRIVVHSKNEIEKIAEMTKTYYNQEAILVYKLSNDVLFVGV